MIGIRNDLEVREAVMLLEDGAKYKRLLTKK
jgi:hypothetical protein